MLKTILFNTISLLFVFSACTSQPVHKNKITPPSDMITPPKTGLILDTLYPDGSYIIKTTSLPTYITVSVTINAEQTVDAGMQAVLEKLNLPVTEMTAWPGQTTIEEGGIFHEEFHRKKQFYKARAADQDIEVELRIISLDFLADSVNSSQHNENLVVRVDKDGKKRYLKLNDDLKQPGNKYSQTGSIGIRISGKLKNGKSASQVVYMRGVVEFTSEEFKKMKWSF